MRRGQVLDPHTHSDFSLQGVPSAEAKLRRGVTPEVTGRFTAPGTGRILAPGR